MAQRVVLTDQHILMLILAAQSYGFAAVRDEGFGRAHDLATEWEKAVKQYAVAVEDNSPDVSACRARVIRLSQQMFEAVDWTRVGDIANVIWLKDQLRDLGEPNSEDKP